MSDAGEKPVAEPVAEAPVAEAAAGEADGEAGVALESAPTMEKGAAKCTKCEKKFGMFVLRHNCRACGLTFCDNCSAKKHEMPPNFGYKGAQRVCENCYFYLASLALEQMDNKPEPLDMPLIHAKVTGDVERFLRDAADEGDSAWVSKANKKNVDVAVRALKDSNIHCVRSRTVIPVEPKAAYAMYTAKQLWKHWNPELLECRAIETEEDNHAEVLYVSYRFPVIDNRDVVMYSTQLPGLILEPATENAFSILATSVEHPLGPRHKGFVRAIIKLSATQFAPVAQPDGSIHTQLTSIVHMDPRGLIPSAVVNQTYGKVCDQLALMAKYMSEHKDEHVDLIPGVEKLHV